jgi:membrane protein
MNSDRPTPTFKIFNIRTQQLVRWSHRIKFPGTKGIPVYDVITLFFKGLMKGSLNIRATSIAFHFLLALGPAIIFLLGLIPYLPVRNFQQGLMEILVDVIPKNSYIALELLLQDLFQKHNGLQIFGFLVTLYFVQKGINGIIEAFNATYHTMETRPWMERRLISVGLFAILFILVTFAAILLFFSNLGIKYLYVHGIIMAYANYLLLQLGKWAIILALTFLAISFLFYLAPARKTKWRFFTPGSILATLLSIMTSIGFSYFVNHFAPFNRFFGSIGTLIAVMLWMNFNALALLAGFELNASIKNARFTQFEPMAI